MNGATPQLVHILKRLLGVDQIEFLTLEEMLDIQLTIPTIVAVVNNQVWITEIGQAGYNPITHLFPIFLHDNPFISFFSIEVEVKFLYEVFGQVITQERDIVIELAYL